MHTIASMMMISELCAASSPFRTRLSHRRNQQRSQSAWFYKIVEIGTATNFIADQFLKTRAGENVMALMSAVIPVMPKSSCNATILLMFEKSGASLDSTPGLSQVERVRDAVAPLAAAMKIKEKVLQYHCWMKNLITQAKDGETNSPVSKVQADLSPLDDAYDAIPCPSTIADVVLLLHRVCSSDESTFTVKYWGLSGAAWVAAYAQDVLGLPVCILLGSNKTVPLSGDYASAKVVLHICSKENRCQLQRTGKIEEYVCTQPLADDARKGWTVDLGVTSYLELCFGQGQSVQKRAANFLAGSMALSCVGVMIKTFYWTNLNPDSGLVSFLEHHTPDLEKKALRNLRLLGFDLSLTMKRDAWKKYIWYHTPNHLKQAYNHRARVQRFVQKPGFNFQEHAAPTEEWIKSFGTDLTGHCDLYGKFSGLSPEGSADFNHAGQHMISSILKAVNFASVMALTDWGSRYRAMSVSYLQHSWNFDEPHPLIYCDLLHTMLTSVPRLAFTMNDLITYTLSLVTNEADPAETADFADPSHYIIAVSVDAVVVLRAMAIEPHGDPFTPVFLSFHPGSIISDGEQRLVIKSEQDVSSEFAEVVIEPSDSIAPSNEARGLELITRARPQRDVLYIQTEALLNSVRLQTVDVVGISEAIPRLFFSARCEHSYVDAFEIPRSQNERWVDQDKRKHERIAKWQGGLSFQYNRRPAHASPSGYESRMYVQNVDKNPKGQWIACQWTTNLVAEDSPRILQTETCLSCIYWRLRPFFLQACIINGRLPNEARRDCRGRGASCRSETAGTKTESDLYRVPTEELSRHTVSEKVSKKSDSPLLSDSSSKPQDSSPSHSSKTFKDMGLPALEQERLSRSWTKRLRSHSAS